MKSTDDGTALAVGSPKYLDTLRRIPTDIFLAIFAQDFDELDNSKCVCGWAAREAIARCVDKDPEATRLPRVFDGDFGESWQADSYDVCRQQFGGPYFGWKNLYDGAIADMRNVETAVVDRLNEILGYPVEPSAKPAASRSSENTHPVCSSDPNRDDCRQMMAVTHSLRDSLVIADLSSVECSIMVKDSLVARAKRQP